MEDEIVLVSESNKTFFLDFVKVLAFLFFFIFAYSQSIVAVSWIGCIISILPLLILFYLISSCFKKVYYFTKNKIIIADHNHKYIDEIEIKEGISWNAYSEKNRGGKIEKLVVKIENEFLIIEKSDYKNYDFIVNYFKNSLVIRDTNLKDKIKLTLHNNISELDIKLSQFSVFLSILFVFLFWMIISNKSDSKEIKYFEGIIKEIEPIRRRVNIKLENYPKLTFRFENDISFFTSYNYNFGNRYYVNLNKKIRIGISKADYEWKKQKKFISILNLNSSYIDAENYKMIE